MMIRRKLLGAGLTMAGTVLAATVWAAPGQAVTPPRNAPADVRWDARGGKLSLAYHGTIVLDAVVSARDKDGKETRGGITMQPALTTGQKVEQRVKSALAKPQEGVELVLRGTVTGSEEAFPAETRSEARKRFPYVRNSVGLSCNLRDNAVYDRRWDWVLIDPGDGRTCIEPERADKHHLALSWASRGSGLELVFRPRFYQKHKGLKRFTPCTYKGWKGSLTDCCTWWSYKGNFTQETLDALLGVFVQKHLPDCGY